MILRRIVALTLRWPPNEGGRGRRRSRKIKERGSIDRNLEKAICLLLFFPLCFLGSRGGDVVVVVVVVFVFVVISLLKFAEISGRQTGDKMKRYSIQPENLVAILNISTILAFTID